MWIPAEIAHRKAKIRGLAGICKVLYKRQKDSAMEPF